MSDQYRYARAFADVIAVEGIYSIDPNDDGNWTGGKKDAGELRGTKYGISAKAYPHLDINNLTIDKAREIYKTDYWDACQCDEIPDPLSTFVFDAAVNQGVGAAKKMLQEALGVAIDGVIGNKTLAAAKNSTKYDHAQFMTIRAIKYMSTRNSDRYLAGWLNRLFKIAIRGYE